MHPPCGGPGEPAPVPAGEVARPARASRRGAHDVQLDGSRERWFGAELPFASLHAPSTMRRGKVVGAVFREHEDAAGYFAVIAQLLERHGVPLAAYTDKHSIFASVHAPGGRVLVRSAVLKTTPTLRAKRYARADQRV